MSDKHYWQDARFKKALENAPDTCVPPTEATRSNILFAAEEAIKNTPSTTQSLSRKWWNHLIEIFTPKAYIPWNAAFATVVIAVGVGVVWTVSNPQASLDPTYSEYLPSEQTTSIYPADDMPTAPPTDDFDMVEESADINVITAPLASSSEKTVQQKVMQPTAKQKIDTPEVTKTTPKNVDGAAPAEEPAATGMKKPPTEGRNAGRITESTAESAPPSPTPHSSQTPNIYDGDDLLAATTEERTPRDINTASAAAATTSSNSNSRKTENRSTAPTNNKERVVTSDATYFDVFAIAPPLAGATHDVETAERASMRESAISMTGILTQTHERAIEKNEPTLYTLKQALQQWHLAYIDTDSQGVYVTYLEHERGLTKQLMAMTQLPLNYHRKQANANHLDPLKRIRTVTFYNKNNTYLGTFAFQGENWVFINNVKCSLECKPHTSPASLGQMSQQQAESIIHLLDVTLSP